MAKETKQPIDKVRFGAIQAAIWENDGEKGTWHNVTLTRTYRDSSDELKDTSNLSGTDLLVGAVALVQAFVRIQELRKAE